MTGFALFCGAGRLSGETPKVMSVVYKTSLMQCNKKLRMMLGIGNANCKKLKEIIEILL